MTVSEQRVEIPFCTYTPYWILECLIDEEELEAIDDDEGWSSCLLTCYKRGRASTYGVIDNEAMDWDKGRGSRLLLGRGRALTYRIIDGEPCRRVDLPEGVKIGDW